MARLKVHVVSDRPQEEVKLQFRQLLEHYDLAVDAEEAIPVVVDLQHLPCEEPHREQIVAVCDARRGRVFLALLAPASKQPAPAKVGLSAGAPPRSGATSFPMEDEQRVDPWGSDWPSETSYGWLLDHFRDKFGHSPPIYHTYEDLIAAIQWWSDQYVPPFSNMSKEDRERWFEAIADLAVDAMRATDVFRGSTITK